MSLFDENFVMFAYCCVCPYVIRSTQLALSRVELPLLELVVRIHDPTEALAFLKVRIVNAVMGSFI